MSSIERDSKGIPLKSSYPEKPSVFVLYSVLTLVLGIVGFIIAWYGIYTLSDIKRNKADSKIDILREYELGYLYFGIFFIKLLQLPYGILLGAARKESKIGLPDQHIYQVYGAEGSKLGYVMMDNEGIHGKFNRAQRALMNYHENFPTLMFQYILCSFVFPFESMICMLVWAVLGAYSAYGYVQSVDGRQNGMLLRMVIINVLQGLVLIIAIESV